jgi:ribosomal protein S18 acetylase RimI-like enzyme
MPPHPLIIAPATTPDDIAAVGQLFREYAGSLEINLCFQNFAAELAGLPGAYAHPNGRLLLARVDGEAAGCVALRPHAASAGEMKRLYVRPDRQGAGLGRRLVGQVIAEARDAGYTTLLLDTLPTMTAAIALYESFGFVRREPYYPSPVVGSVFMELRL